MATTCAKSDAQNTHTQDKKALKLQDISTKMKIASNVVKACEMEADAKRLIIELNQVIGRVNFYTRTDFYMIYKARVKQKMKFETPYSFIQEETVAARRKFCFYEQIREVYVDYLLNKTIVPKRDILYKTVFSARPNSKQNDEHFRNSGFTWLKLPGTGNGIIIEDPDQVKKRCEYLSKITKFRNEDRNIVYIDIRCVSPPKVCDEDYSLDFNRAEYHPYLITVANKHGLVDLYFFNLNAIVFKKLIPNLSVKLPAGSVFVIGERKLPEKEICPLPNEYSSKQDMFDFLENNNIPFDKKMHRADLYSLIQKNKQAFKEKLYNMDDKILPYGQQILRRPFGLPALSFFGNNFYEDKDDKTKKRKSKLYMIKTRIHSYTTSEDFQRMEQELIERERKIYTEDVKIEEIIDKIVMMARDGAILQTDEVLYLKDTELSSDRSDFIIP